MTHRADILSRTPTLTSSKLLELAVDTSVLPLSAVDAGSLVTRREVLGRAAAGQEREQLWQRWRDFDQKLDGYAARRAQETAVVVLEPRSVAG